MKTLSNILVFSILLLLALTSCEDAFFTNDNTPDHSGDTILIRETTYYSPISGDSLTQSGVIEYTHYSNGLVKEIFNNNVLSVTYQYDDKGREISKIYNGSKAEFHHIYNGNLLMAEIDINQGDTTHLYAFVYNDLEQVTNKIRFRKNFSFNSGEYTFHGNLYKVFETEFIYNELSQVKEETIFRYNYGGGREKINVVKYDYDSYGNTINTTTYDAFGDLLYEEEKEYIYTDGRLFEEYNENQTWSYKRYAYDEKGRIISEFDVNGNEVEKNIYDEKRLIEKQMLTAWNYTGELDTRIIVRYEYIQIENIIN